MPKAMDDLMGNTYPGRIWQNYMNRLHEGLPAKEFVMYTDTRPSEEEEGDEEENEGEEIKEGEGEEWEGNDGEGQIGSEGEEQIESEGGTEGIKGEGQTEGEGGELGGNEEEGQMEGEGEGQMEGEGGEPGGNNLNGNRTDSPWTGFPDGNQGTQGLKGIWEDENLKDQIKDFYDRVFPDK